MLSVVIVNFNTGYRLKQAVDGCLARPPRGGMEIIVVENNSADGSSDFLADPKYADVRLVKPGVNAGYSEGNNIGFEHAKGDVVLLMTPDRYPLDDALDRMARRFEEDPTLGAMGGYCLWADGTLDHHFLGLPTPWQSYLYTFWRPQAKRLPSMRRYLGLDLDLAKPFEVPQPAGGCFAFRRHLLESPIQHPGFGLFYSDVDTARRVADTGLRTLVDPDIRFVHDHDHKPYNPVSGPLLTLDYYVGVALYHRIHNGWLAYATVKTLFALHLTAWMARETAARLLGRQTREQYRRHRDLYWNYLRDRNIILDRAKTEMRAKGMPRATYPIPNSELRV